MRQRIKIETGFPSAAKVAKKLGVSKEVAKQLAILAEQSMKTGNYVLPGFGRLVSVKKQKRVGSSPARKVVKFPASEGAKGVREFLKNHQ